MNASLHLFDLDRHSLPGPTTFEDLEALRERLARKADGKNLRFIPCSVRIEPQLLFTGAGRAAPLAPGEAQPAWR